MERMTVSRRERPDAARAIERRHGLRARCPPQGMRLPPRSGPARRCYGLDHVESHLRHVCLFRELRSGDECIARDPLPLEAVARRQRGVNRWHGSKAVHRCREIVMRRSRECVSRCESLDTRVARIVVFASQIALAAKTRCPEMNKIGAHDGGIDRAMPLGT
jgi:hypothetical protein